MNHTLKSLLITSMLTIPTVFASQDSLFGTNSDAQPAAAATALGQPTLVQQTDVPALIKEADRLRNLKTSTMDSAEKIRLHTTSADLYETAAKHPNATPENIRLAANWLSCLVAPVSDRALPLFELFVNSSGVTSMHIQNAADILNNSKGKHGSNSDARLQHIKKVIKLFELSTTHTNSTLQDTLNAADKLRDFGEKETKPAEKVLYLDGSVALYEQAANHPDATPENIRLAADKAYYLGNYHPQDSDERNLHLERLAKLYIKLANHSKASPENIRLAAARLNDLANKHPQDSDKRKLYLDNAAELFEKSANHSNAHYDDLPKAAHGVRNLGYQYHPRAAELYTRFANHMGLSPSSILLEEHETGKQDIFHDMAPLVYELFAKHPATTVNDILFQAKNSFDLGNSFPRDNVKTYEKASILFKFAANHPKATPWDIRNAADGLYALAETYPEGSAERKLHLDKSATLYDGLATLYEKSANHPEATSWDILNAANDLNALANKYPEGSAERKKFATIARNLPRK